ncbi:myosin regulatory light chain 2, smooth muscle minor isoform isoform X1 [Corvus cornix cornix]|uniref:myosin regulatory light chain 2, smooth muscle minor isoform isoform X1 n=1 Tax=Corvus cornix cornix TaxID=932674 RepID=UPI00194F3859|nr:myosin regulatory light chain 2, smooth muscle minor isoform isoform X1 [Corvus cornix cornix]
MRTCISGLFLVRDIMVCFLRQKNVVDARFKSVELAGEVSSCLCGQTERDVTMEFPFMLQMLGTPCQVSNTKQEPTATMSSKRAKTKTTKKRPQRATSNVFAMFDQSQIQEFKEAFNMIDQNRDGFIDKEDLHDMLASLGKNPTDEYLDAMMNEAPGPINFTMFLTMFGEKLNGTDPEDVIRNAFACFDEEATGFIQEDYLRELLTTMGDRFTDEEVDELYREAPIDKKGNFNYIEFTRILKHGAKDKDD